MQKNSQEYVYIYIICIYIYIYLHSTLTLHLIFRLNETSFYIESHSRIASTPPVADLVSLTLDASKQTFSSPTFLGRKEAIWFPFILSSNWSRLQNMWNNYVGCMGCWEFLSPCFISKFVVQESKNVWIQRNTGYNMAVPTINSFAFKINERIFSDQAVGRDMSWYSSPRWLAMPSPMTPTSAWRHAPWVPTRRSRSTKQTLHLIRVQGHN